MSHLKTRCRPGQKLVLVHASDFAYIKYSVAGDLPEGSIWRMASNIFAFMEQPVSAQWRFQVEWQSNPRLETVVTLAKPHATGQLLDTVKDVLHTGFSKSNHPRVKPKHYDVSLSASGDQPVRAYFAHPNALIDEGVSIGQGTRVWAFAHVLGGAILGEDCNICDHTFIEGGVRIGNRVTVKCGVFLWDGITIEDDVFIGPGAVFTNDYRPRSKQHLKTYLQTILRKGCTLGAGSTTLPGITIGRWAMVGAGSVVTHDVPDYALVVGNPARRRAWVCRCGEKLFPTSGRLLGCTCGRAYEQIAENEVKEANG
jgi:acetyltransferase-like isoleucine patch superfamily enzyme